MTTITALPTPPTRQDPASFATRGDAFMAALPDFVTEANAVASEINTAAAAVAADEASATTAAANAAADAASALTSKNSAAADAASALSSKNAASASQTAAASSASAAATSEANAAAAAAVGLPEIGTYAALRAYSGGVAAFLVRGVANIFDGGFGIFRVDSADTTSADNGGTILVDANGRRWKRDYLGDADAKWFGAKGDGATDDTDSLQSCLNLGGDIYIPDGTFIANPLNLVSNTNLTLSPNAQIKAKAGFGANDRLINIVGVSDITINGNGAVIKMLKSEYTTGDQRHGVFIVGSENVTIRGLTSEDSGGDGFYVGNVVCRNVLLDHCTADNNKRNGLAITNGIGVRVTGGVYKNTSGYSFGPCCGIDIESNLQDDYYLQDIVIDGVFTSGNVGGGILVTPQSKFAPVSITVRDCTSYDDGSLSQGKGGISCTAAMAYTSSTSAGLIGKISGSVVIENCSILNPRATAFASVNWTENAPDTIVTNLYVLNPYSGGESSPSNRHKCGVLIRGETPSSGTFGTGVGYIEFDGLKVEDNRTVPLMYSPIYFEPADEATKPLKNIRIVNVDVVAGQWVSGSVFPAIKAGSLANTNVEIGYKRPFIVDQPTSSMDTGKIGSTISTVASSNFTLPSAANYIGSTFNFLHRNAGNFQVTPQAGDVIQHLSIESGSGIIARNVGAALSVKATASGVWQVVNTNGMWAVRTGYEPRYPTTFDTAAPTTGTWSQGDIIFNKNATASGFIGWVCTTGGSPGTWKTFGAISA